MEPTPQDKLAAAAFETGLTVGFLPREDVVRWADRRIMELEYAPAWLAELSESDVRPLIDVLNALEKLAAGTDPVLVFKGTLALLTDAPRLSPERAELLAVWVYEIARHLIGDWENTLVCEADELATAFSLARSGQGTLTTTQAVERLTRFIEAHRDPRMRDAVSPAKWSDPEPRVLSGFERDPGHPIIQVGLSSWIIQDGNYDDFTAGQEASFALEFYAPNGLTPAEGRRTSARRLSGAKYLVQACVVYARPDVWVIDAGTFLAYCGSQPPAHAMAGAWVEGEIHLGIDPFFYFEGLHRMDGMPPLTHRWLVLSIERETTPWIEAQDASGRPLLEPDARREGYLPTTRTDAWHDDQGNATYVLHCERLSGPELPGSA